MRVPRGMVGTLLSPRPTRHGLWVLGLVLDRHLQGQSGSDHQSHDPIRDAMGCCELEDECGLKWYIRYFREARPEIIGKLGCATSELFLKPRVTSWEFWMARHEQSHIRRFTGWRGASHYQWDSDFARIYALRAAGWQRRRMARLPRKWDALVVAALGVGR